MADDNKVKLELDLDLPDETLQAAKKKLEGFAREYEEIFKRRKNAAAGGENSPAFVFTNAQLKDTTKNLQGAKNEFVKVAREVEAKNGPVLKRAGGIMHRLWYGNDVTSQEEAERADRRMNHRMSTFQKQLHSTLALSSALSSTLSPLPGGQALHAGVSGFTSGFANGQVDQETGERRRGVRGMAHGLLGGLKGMVSNAGVTLLAKAVAGGVQGSREEENLSFGLAQSMGGDITGAQSGRYRDLRRAMHSAPGMTAAQAAPLVNQVGALGGGKSSAQAALQMQLVSGQGGAFTSLLGGMAQGGAGTKQLDASARKILTDVFATGTAQGLSRGRIGELIVGAQQVAAQRHAGVGGGDPSEILRMSAMLGGQNTNYAGSRGFETIGKLESFGKGETSPMARALSLMQNGLSSGGNYVEAMRKSERGIFGEGGMGIEGLQGMVGKVNKMAGGNRDQASLLLKNMSGMGLNESTDVLDMMASGKFGEKEFKELGEKTKKPEEKLYDVMKAAAGDWKAIDKLLEHIDLVLGEIFKDGGVLDVIKDALKLTVSLLEEIRDFMKGVKEKGVGGAINDELHKLMGDKHEGYYAGEMTAANDPNYAKHAAAMSTVSGLASKTAHPRVRDEVDKEGKTHIYVELVNNQGEVILRNEWLDSKNGKAPQARGKLQAAR